MHFFKEHEPRNDDGKDGKNTHRAEDIIVVADQVSDHEVAAHGVQQEPALVNDGSGVEGENHDAGDSAEESPEKKYQVQATKALAENAVGRGEHRSEHADTNGQHDDAKNEEVETANENFLAERD